MDFNTTKSWSTQLMSGSTFCWSTKQTCIKIHMCSYWVVYLLLNRSLIVEHCSGSNGELPGFVYIYMYTLPSLWTSLRAAATFRVTWSGYVTEIHWPRRLGKTPYGDRAKDRANVQQCCQNHKALLQRLTRVSPQPSYQGLLVFRTWFRGSANKTKGMDMN